MPHVDEGTLHAYLDGELPSAERKTLETHLAECASCRTQLAEERALLERASALLGATRPIERAAPPFEQLRPRATRRSLWRVRTPVAWAASIALALGVGYSLHEPVAHPVASIPEQQNLTLSRQVDERGRTEPQAEENKPAPATATPRHARKLAAAPAPTVATIPPARRDSAAAAAGGARVDSGAFNREAEKSAAGVVAILPQAATPQLRNAAPPVASASKANDSVQLQEPRIIVDGVQVSRAADSRGPTTTTWPIISRGAARSLLGTDPVGLPGLARQIRRSPSNDGTVVVEQKIDSATTIQIFQQQNATAAFYYRIDTSVRADKARPAQERDMAVAPADRLARYVGRLRVEIAGPLSSDSLNKLLDQVQPLP